MNKTDWLGDCLAAPADPARWKAEYRSHTAYIQARKVEIDSQRFGVLLCIYVNEEGWVFDQAARSDSSHVGDVRLCEVVKALLAGMPIGAALDLLMEVLPEDNTLCRAMAKILGV